jgi:hypothetical protein
VWSQNHRRCAKITARAHRPLRMRRIPSAQILCKSPQRIRSSPTCLQRNEGVKTLGLLWHLLSDQFLISEGTYFQTLWEPTNTPISKCVVSSLIAALFDPLGLFSPVTVVHKIFLQQLWMHKLEWDEQLPSALLKQWMDIYEPLSQVNEITIDRLVLTRGQPTEIQLHGFCNSSERAYGACSYLRSLSISKGKWLLRCFAPSRELHQSRKLHCQDYSCVELHS